MWLKTQSLDISETKNIENAKKSLWFVTFEIEIPGMKVDPMRPASYMPCRYDRRCTYVPIICAGTIITEWGEGTMFWEDVLSSELKLQNFISVLVTIAQTLKFDGWLLNIENKVQMLPALLRYTK